MVSTPPRRSVPELPALPEAPPPHDIDAEEGVIGSVLIDAATYPLVASLLSGADFYRDRHRQIWAAFEGLTADRVPIDLVTVASRLDALGYLEATGGYTALTAIVAGIPTSVHAEHYAHIVKNAAIKRELIGGASQVAAIGYGPESGATALAAAQEIIAAIGRSASLGGPRSLDDVLDALITPSDNVHQSDDTVPTGLHEVDWLLGGGLRAANLVVLAARPSVGKSALGVGIASHVAIATGRTALIYSLEMSRAEIASRMVTGMAGIPTKRLKPDQLSEGELQRVYEAAELLSLAPILVDDTPNMTLAAILTQTRRHSALRRLGLVVIDYLGLITPPKADNRVQEIAAITAALKGLAREVDAPVLLLAQLNRQTETRTDRRPMLSDLRDSGAIEQDADVVMFLYREDMQGSEGTWAQRYPGTPYPRGTAELHIAKQRNGPTGRVALRFHDGLTRFANPVAVQS